MLYRGSLARCYSPRGEFGFAPPQGILTVKPKNASMQKTQMYRLYLPCNTQKIDEIIHLYLVGAVWYVAIPPEMNLGWPYCRENLLTNQRTRLCRKRSCTGFICLVVLKNTT